MKNNNQLESFRKQLEGLNAQERINWAIQTFGIQELVLASSFSLEDQTLTAMAAKQNSNFSVVTLDTGRLFQETYDCAQESAKFFDVNYIWYYPDPQRLSEMVSKSGPNLFYDKVEYRLLCCNVRKVQPLTNALKNNKIWITGQRKEHSPLRLNSQVLEWDDQFGLYKLNPLLDWDEDEVLDFVKENGLPVNNLLSRGYRSIGCAPCTRSIGQEEPVRAGRWWWENTSHKECGLHLK